MRSESLPDAGGSALDDERFESEAEKKSPQIIKSDNKGWEKKKLQTTRPNELNTHARMSAHTAGRHFLTTLSCDACALFRPYDQSTSKSSSFKYSYKALEDGCSASLFSPHRPTLPSLFLSPGVLIIPPVSPPHRVGGVFFLPPFRQSF